MKPTRKTQYLDLKFHHFCGFLNSGNGHEKFNDDPCPDVLPGPFPGTPLFPDEGGVERVDGVCLVLNKGDIII